MTQSPPLDSSLGSLPEKGLQGAEATGKEAALRDNLFRRKAQQKGRTDKVFP